MATLVLTGIGTAIGGPLGGALGALVGNQLDRALVGSRKREGPRLRELSVTTSSYGTPIARHYGQTRTPGTIIWSTDLRESEEESGGSKGQPTLKTYSYTCSFAVALASRPIRRIGRVWADGNLLRGSQGDLKVGGELRIYKGHGDQERDPLIASDRGAACPAFRNLAYCVFENLQLADFGNRIPGLTFEVIADDSVVSLTEIAAGRAGPLPISDTSLPIIGYSDEGGSLAANLATIDQVYPVTTRSTEFELFVRRRLDLPEEIPELPQPAMDFEEESFGPRSGTVRVRQLGEAERLSGVRYYDIDRDYQASLQRADGLAMPGQARMLEFPAVLDAAEAKALANSGAQRDRWAGDTIRWRLAELDPDIHPGRVVSLPGRSGNWLIEAWEWRTTGVELELRQMAPTPAVTGKGTPGEALPPKDKTASPTLLQAFEMPWDGTGSSSTIRIFAATSSVSDGWTGAALYAEQDGQLAYLGPAGKKRSVIGKLVEPLAGDQSHILNRQGYVIVDLASPDFVLSSTTMAGLARGENSMLIGGEVLQFATAMPLGDARWKVSHLLRGRAGTEAVAAAGHKVDAPVIFLNGLPTLLDVSGMALGGDDRIAAIGHADEQPVISAIANSGNSRKPPTPVHPRLKVAPDGGWLLSWTRRARGAWSWVANGEVPIIEETEKYVVGFGSLDDPVSMWITQAPTLLLSTSRISELLAGHPSEKFWVRQVGTFADSDALLLVDPNRKPS